MKPRKLALTFGAVAAMAATLLVTSAANAQITLPWNENFEAANGETYTQSTDPLTGLPEWAFHTGLENTVGPVDISMGAGTAPAQPFYEELIFSVTSQVVLEAVSVYPTTAGTVHVNLYDTNMNLLQQAIQTVSQTNQMVQIPVGFIINPGTGYRMDAVGSTANIFRNTTGATYPYTNGGVSITGNSYNQAYYYWFYNWQILSVSDGRLQMASGYYNGGTASAAMDRVTCPVPNVQNYLTATLDMSNYAVANDPAELEFYVRRFSDEHDDGDRCWIRGSTSDPWVEVADLYNETPTVSQFYLVNVDVATALSNAGQDFSSTFQISFGQDDDCYMTSDGFVIDDVSLFLPQVCGNNVTEGTEACDDGNTNDCDGCRGDCSAVETGCGDTFVCGSEACDDGNNNNCDSCSNACTAITGCGDGQMCGSEACDDGNTTSCDGCSATCTTETGCGDNVVCGNEVCDDGNNTDCDGCRADCSAAETGCGDTFVCGSEVCDDGNTTDCDGCRADCSAAETGCGDTFICGTETCDDGNTTACDGCSDTCVTETGCGDGVTCGTEVCDDGNTTDCDGCSADCSLAETGCGDGAMCGTETCDDGNTTSCDGCSDTCVTETGCGDGVLCGSEQCDDGNTIDGDGCSSTCMSEGTGGAGGTTSSGTGGTTSSGTGGTTSSGTGGASSSSGSDGDTTDDGGCGCRVVGQSQSNNLAALGLLGLLGLVVTRRRRAA